jgi:putative flippase GtrA
LKSLFNKLLNWEFFRFIVVGGTNAVVDIGVLNILVLFVDWTSGFRLFALTVVSTSCAMVNSYMLNNRWTFARQQTNAANNAERGEIDPPEESIDKAEVNSQEDVDGETEYHLKRKRSKRVSRVKSFLLITLMGNYVINSGSVWFLTSTGLPDFGLSPVERMNAAKLIGIGLATFWNFFGYKRWVFNG